MDHLNLLNDTGDYVKWIKAEFAPITLITPDATISQCVNNAVRRFNTCSAVKHTAMVEYTGSARIEVPASFKQVVQVYPNKIPLTLFGGLNSLWALSGVAIIDNVTTDLILLSEALRNYTTYLGLGFEWTYNQNIDDPTGKGSLFVQNVPAGVDKLYVVGSMRILPDSVIENQWVNDFILNYSKALVKMVEGNSLRKSSMILGHDIDGQQLVDEGKEEKQKLEEDLRVNGRWCVMAVRT